MNIVIMGPPGVGKGTQSHKICADHNVVHISTGDILRMAIRSGTDLGLDTNSGIISRLTWNGSSWSAEQTIPKAPGVVGTVLWTTLASDPQSDRIALGVPIYLGAGEGEGPGPLVSYLVTKMGHRLPVPVTIVP